MSYGKQYCLPSAPVLSTIRPTFSAHAVLLASVFAAFLKPSSLPHPPIATMILVSSGNFARASSTVMNNGHSCRSGWLNISERMNARATCVTSLTRERRGTRGCWLHSSVNFSHIRIDDLRSIWLTYPVRYIMYLGHSAVARIPVIDVARKRYWQSSRKAKQLAMVLHSTTYGFQPRCCM